MLTPSNITFRDVPHSDAIESHIKKRIDKLNTFCKRILSCNVVVEQAQKHKTQGKLYNARIALKVPGMIFAVNHAINEDVYVALRDAFNALRRKLRNHMKRKQGKIKNHDIPLHGRISRVNNEESYGFIEHNGDDYYFSSNNLVKLPFDKLVIGTEVQFISSMADEGMQAHRITVGKHNYFEVKDLEAES